MLSKFKNTFRQLQRVYNSRQKEKRIQNYLRNGNEPWSVGYEDYKWDEIKAKLLDQSILNQFKSQQLPAGFGKRLDERIIEYPWIINQLSRDKGNLLDAGSTFNFETIINLETIANKNLTICTYSPEHINFNERRISYQYCDLRFLPFKEQWFDEIVCQSTLEHIDMDNSMYGNTLKSTAIPGRKSVEYMRAVNELYRCLKINGTLLITVPFGTNEHHGFFQQFDKEMIQQATSILEANGSVELTYFKYLKQGWVFSNQPDCENSHSYNPKTGAGKDDDGAAHCRAICCIKFFKEK